MHQNISTMDLQEILKTGNYTLIDVREPIELEMDGKFEEAINIPLGEIEGRLNEIKNISIHKILFCRSGGRSASAVQFLQNHNINDVSNGGGFGFLNMLMGNQN